MTVDRAHDNVTRCIFRMFRPFFYCMVVVFSLIWAPEVHSSLTDPMIAAIRVEGLTRMREDEFIALIGLRPGDRLERNTLGAGIKRAFRKGLFHDIKAVTDSTDGSIDLIYYVDEIPVIGDIIISGNSFISKKRIRDVFPFRKGEGFKDLLLYTSIEDIQTFYRRKGFPEATVSVIVEQGNDPSVVCLHLWIKEGQPQRISKVQIPFHLSRLMRIKTGSIFDRDEVDRDIERLKGYFRKNQYINPIVGPYRYMNGELVVPIAPGPRLRVSFRRNKAISTKDLMRELPFIDEGEINDELIEGAVDRITRLYHARGYRDAEIAAAVFEEEELVKLSFFIYEGREIAFGKIGIKGNSIPTDALMSIIPIKEGKPYSAELIGKSREDLINFYNALGYLYADITEIRESFQDDDSNIDIVFVVQEGVQVHIKKINIAGNTIMDSFVIESVLHLYSGAPYNVIDIGDARHRVQSLYRRFGYLDAMVEIKSRIIEDEAYLDIVVVEKLPSVVGKIIIRGNQKTRDRTIRREFTIDEGDRYDMDKVTRLKQKLYKLGLFSEVTIDILPPAPSEIREEDMIRDVLVTVKESKAGSIEIGVGYGDYEKFRGSLEVGYRNIGGLNRQIILRSEFSDVDEKYILHYREPWLFNRAEIPLNVYLKKEEGESINVDTREVLYKFDKVSFVSEVEIELLRHLKVGFSYEYAYSDTTDVAPGVIIRKEDLGTLGISSVSTGLFYDLRDNPFDPTSGSLNGIVMKFASKAYLSEVEFVKATIQSTWFFPMKKKVIFAVSLKGGIAHAFGNTKDLPLIERFFLGGRTTVRGYTNDSLGPKGENDVPTGGNVFTLMNSEFRVPVRKELGAVVFLDGGNVWRDLNDVDNKLKYTIGAGLRYKTPVGPARIDYGHKLNREEGESAGELHFTFGHAF